MSLEFKFVPLTFISSKEAIEVQLNNTVLFKKVAEKYNNYVQLGDLILSTQYGFTASAKETGTHKLLRITDINNGFVNWSNVPLCDCDRENNYVLSTGDILIARTGNNISYMVDENVPKNAVFASYLIRIVCDKNKILPEYLYLFLNSYAFWPQILLKQRGALLQNVNANLMRQLLIPMCSIEEQKGLLKNVDTGLVQSIEIEKKRVSSLFKTKVEISTELTHQLTLVKKLRQQLLQDAVQGKLVEQNPTDEPASELLKKIKAEKVKLIAEKVIKQGKIQEAEKQEELLFEIPQNWIWCTLDEISKNITDGTHQTPVYTKEGRIFLSAQNIKPFKFMPEEHKFVSEEAYEEIIKNRKPEKGDILIARVGAGIGEAAVINQDIDFCFYVSLGLVQPFKEFLNTEYLPLVINSPYGVKYAKGNISSKGGSAGNFNLGRIRSFLIPLPPLAEQERIIQKVEELMQYCNKLEASIKQSEALNEKLLQQVLREALRKEPVEV